MQTWQIIGVIVAILALTISVLMHLFKTAWWMATLTATLQALKNSVDKIEGRIAHYEANHLSREDAFRELGRIDAKADAAHKRIDSINGNK